MSERVRATACRLFCATTCERIAGRARVACWADCLWVAHGGTRTCVRRISSSLAHPYDCSVRRQGDLWCTTVVRWTAMKKNVKSGRGAGCHTTTTWQRRSVVRDEKASYIDKTCLALLPGGMIFVTSPRSPGLKIPLESMNGTGVRV